MSILALCWGILSFVFLAVGIFPCLGWLNWFIIPFALMGGVFSFIAYKKTIAPESPLAAQVAIAMNSVVVLVGSLRLFVGGGLL